MSPKLLVSAKLLLALLAIAGPLGLYQARRNHQRLLEADRDLVRRLASERELILERVVQSFFDDEDLLARARLVRELPDGPIQKLPPFPGALPFVEAGGLRLGERTDADPRYLEMLHARDDFTSGLPKRYAGLVELLRGSDVVLGPADHDRFHEVAAELWLGRDLDDETHAFLLEKLPEQTCAVFDDQQRFLGLDTSRPPGKFLVSTIADDRRYLLELDIGLLDQLEKTLAKLDLGTALEPSDAWLEIGDVRLTLAREDRRVNGRIGKRDLAYLGAGLGLVLILLLLYLVLVEYEKINRSQKQLLAATSHELRTPLAVIRQFAEMLEAQNDSFPEKARTYHGYILRKSLEMQFLVENLLSAARFELVELEVKAEPFSLGAWLEEVVSGMAELVEPNRITLEAPSCSVTWDRDLMSQALSNLLQNARVHAGTDTEVTAIVDDDQVTLAVRDHGETPDLRALRKIRAFKPGSGSVKGLGLGLYITSRISTAHGGELRFEDAEPGLRVLMTLPRTCHDLPDQR